MTGQGELMGIFSNLISEQKPMTLYNTYRGLPFSYEADILAVEQGSVVTHVDRYQAVSMAVEVGRISTAAHFLKSSEQMWSRLTSGRSRRP